MDTSATPRREPVTSRTLFCQAGRVNTADSPAPPAKPPMLAKAVPALTRSPVAPVCRRVPPTAVTSGSLAGHRVTGKGYSPPSSGSSGWVAPEPVGELAGTVPDHEAELAGPLPQVHQQAPCLLHRPGAARLRGHAQDMAMAGAHLDHEEHADTAQGNRAVDMEEIACQHGRGLGAQELPPRGPGAVRRGRYPQALQYSPHRGCPAPV